MQAVCLYIGLREEHHRKKSSFLDGSREFLPRTWRTRGSEMGMDRGSRLRVPDSVRVLVTEANKRMFPSWSDAELREGDRAFLPWRIASRKN